jgi:phenylacetate-CoA ligase
MKIGDLMQKFFMSNPKRAMWFLSTMPASFWERQSEKMALETFHEAAEKVSAYKDFLKKHGVQDHTKIKTIEDFRKFVPIMDKENYLLKYDLQEKSLLPLAEVLTIATSSGTTGKPTYFPVLPQSILPIINFWETCFEIYRIGKIPTLYILTLSLGSWIAGIGQVEALREVGRRKNYQITILHPGSRLNDTLDLIQEFAPKYKQLVIGGYSSFLRRIIDEGEKRGLEWKKMNTILIGGGEPLSEKSKEYLMKKLGHDNPFKIFTNFGIGEAAPVQIGFEYPFAILIKSLTVKNEKLRENFFGQKEILPSLMQKIANVYIEEINGELIYTAKSGLPIVRFNSHDAGGVVPFHKGWDILTSFGYNPESLLRRYGFSKEHIFKFPLFYVFGRNNAVRLPGAVFVYPEQVEEILLSYPEETKEINDFKLYIKLDKTGSPKFYIDIELKKGYKSTKEMRKRHHDLILKKLLEISRDFEDAYRMDPKAADPIIQSYLFSEGPFKIKSVKKYIEE